MALDAAEAVGAARDLQFGRVTELLLLLLLAPVIVAVGAAIAIAIYVDSPGPVIFRSERIGRHGRPFRMLKFRKMRISVDGRPLTLADDERFTPIGRFLSVTRLDELPQVLNVIRGEMRLVGPRPELACFVAQFAEPYEEILTVTPGITGITQLRFVDERALLRGDDPAAAYCDTVMPQKIAIDLAYVRDRSFWGDIAILARTAMLPVKWIGAAARSGWTALQGWLWAALAGIVLVTTFVVSISDMS